MSYNPYSAAFAALTNKEARRFYADTALEHSFLTLAVASITAQRTYEAGQAFRQFYDSHLVPFTLLAIATVVEFFATPEVEAPQLALAGFTPVALLPESKPQARVLVTPCVSESRTLVTPAPVALAVEVDLSGVADSDLSLADLFNDEPEEVVDVDISGGDDPDDVALTTLLEVEVTPQLVKPSTNPTPVGRAMPEPYCEYSYLDLKRLCKARGLSPKGSREALVARLCNSDLFPEPSPSWKLAPRTAPKTIRGQSID